MTKSITLYVKHFLYENGNDEVLILTPRQYAGLKKTKGWKKKLVSAKNKAVLQILIKTP